MMEGREKGEEVMQPALTSETVQGEVGCHVSGCQ